MFLNIIRQILIRTLLACQRSADLQQADSGLLSGLLRDRALNDQVESVHRLFLSTTNVLEVNAFNTLGGRLGRALFRDIRSHPHSITHICAQLDGVAPCKSLTSNVYVIHEGITHAANHALLKDRE